MANLIRLKQLDQADLSGFFNDAFIQTGIVSKQYVDRFSDQTVSGVKTFVDGVNLDSIDTLNLSGVDITITNGNVILTNPVSAPNLVYNTGNQNISGNKSFYGDVLLSGNNNRIGKSQYLSTTVDHLYIKNSNDTIMLDGEEYTLYSNDNLPSVYFGGRELYANNGISINWNQRYLANQNEIPVLTWTGDNIGIGTNNPSEKLQVIGNVLGNNLIYNTGNQTISGVKTFLDNISLGDINAANGSITFADSANGYYNLMQWGDREFALLNKSFADDRKVFAILFNDSPEGGVSIFSSTGSYGRTSKLYLPLGKEGYFGIDNELVHLTGNETISGIKTFRSRPTVNGTGVLLISEAPNLATTVYTTGNQNISGIKTFSEISCLKNPILSGDVINKKYADENLVKYIDDTLFNNTNLDLSFPTGLSGIKKINYTLRNSAGWGVNYNGITWLTNPPPNPTTGNPVVFEYYPIAVNSTQSYGIYMNAIADLEKNRSNIVYTTGAQTISGTKTFANSGVFSLSGGVPLGLPNNPLSIVGSGNNYVQINIQNRATGTTATADLVITANNGTDSTNYINLGINNSGYNDPAFSNGSGLDGYLFVNGGNLDIGTQTPNTQIEFHVGGTTSNRAIARIDNSGINMVSGTYRVNNVPYNVFTITLTHSSSTINNGFNYFGLNDASYSQATLGSRRRIPISETCQIRKASWSHLVGTTGSPAVILSTGYVINTSSIPPQTGIVSTVIDSSNDTTPGHYITNFSTPINVTSGDLIVAALAAPGFVTAPLAARDTVILYCYN